MKDFQAFLDRVNNQRKRLGISEHPAWYRGHQQQTYKLLPGLLRHRNGVKHERNLFAVFRSEGAGHIPETHGDLETLALMQHFGAPTRLLDWTNSLHTALFFAVMSSLSWKVEHPCIWILNPFRLNYQSTGQKVIYDRDDRLQLNYYEAAKIQAWPFQLPVAIAAPWRNARVQAQQGYFTLHGSDLRPIEESAPECVKRIDIPQHLVREIIKVLEASSTNSFVLFPDLGGLAQKLRRQFKLF
ncbi:FRG domain-containing protein [Bradyrhizobium symbiodeficiens]|uniref:FRG domain-containing protein n=1 Tax=Bradyrhizobium symbiodeficiens TaxID=1404367 RepID=A0ABX5WAS2_9BRAD|nr:FRG domain-containing protein [Bradyrhizobium symbiodeficiens]QDF40340.1 FRG domain-containing protein [Bradyrhizobium symbiodeficiens]